MAKSLLITFAFLFTIGNTAIFAQGKTELCPQSPFDSSAAETMLGRGTCTIEGTAQATRNAQTWYANGIEIRLYPVTPYLEEFLELHKKKAGGKTAVYMSDVAYKTALSVTCDENGFFRFRGLKPGKYYLLAYFDFAEKGINVVDDGSVRNGPEITRFYHEEAYTNNYSHRLEIIVTLDKEGSTEKIKLRRRPGISGR
ncbi:carboxypeptidase-like regulatory domain-containing protein [Taibaiella koreensis]|uniref:carboxypeptidase-like regulatory domain-containing protein n=1 Tax=Taibaiella koreensis TaxID=1268548 RepID=UPI0013C2A7F6|nr:carboxypeptidase-like regulatory domain-containing protein [Taibaiella koreensis]